MGGPACRICRHFIRVNDDSYRNVVNRQGFCLLGCLEGDYSLRVSSSVGNKCMGFIFDERNYQITKAERDLDHEWNEYLQSLHDHRSRNYKDLKPVIEAQKDFYEKAAGLKGGMAFMLQDMKTRGIGCDVFRENHKEQFKEVYNMVSLGKRDYLKFIARVSIEIHDRFCNCDAIAFNEEGKKKEIPIIEADPGSPKALVYEAMGIKTDGGI